MNATMDMATRNGLPWTREVEVKCVDRRVDCDLRKLQGEMTTAREKYRAGWQKNFARSGPTPWPRVDARASAATATTSIYSPSGPMAKRSRRRNPRTRSEGRRKDAPRRRRFKLVPFGELRPGVEPLYLVDELIPVAGLVDVWGKAKCYKSFWCLDLMLHVAMGWEYRDRYVRQGAVVYCAFEGAHGYKKRVEALRRHYAIGSGTDVPLYVMPGQANLITEHKLLIADIAAQLGDTKPVAVVLDTLNKSLFGSENKDVDMGAYVRAAEAIRDAFGCVVIIVHHCGYDDTRPRGHSSLPGAVDAQLHVTRGGDFVKMEVEHMRDGPEETIVTGMAKVKEVAVDANGRPMTSLVIVPAPDSPGGAGSKAVVESLIVFRKALDEALIGSKETISINGTPHPAANLEADVRGEFNKNYVAKGETQSQQRDNRKHAFRRAVIQAQSLSLIGVRVYEDRTLSLARNPGRMNEIQPGPRLPSPGRALRDIAGLLYSPVPECPAREGEVADFAGHFPQMSRKPEVEVFEYNRGGHSERPHQTWAGTDRPTQTVRRSAACLSCCPQKRNPRVGRNQWERADSDCVVSDPSSLRSI